jgi:hypothetical protein
VAFATTREFLAQRKANGKSNLVRFIKRSLSSPCTPQVAAVMENGADLQEARLGSVNYQVRVERENLGSFNVPSFVRVRVNLPVYQASDQKLHPRFGARRGFRSVLRAQGKESGAGFSGGTTPGAVVPEVKGYSKGGGSAERARLRVFLRLHRLRHEPVGVSI